MKKIFFRYSLPIAIIGMVFFALPNTTFASDWDIYCTASGCESSNVQGQLFWDTNVTSGNVYQRHIRISNASESDLSVMIQFDGVSNLLSDLVNVSIQDESIVHRLEDQTLSELMVGDGIELTTVLSGQSSEIVVTMTVGDLPDDIQGESVLFDVAIPISVEGKVLSTVSTSDIEGTNSVLGALSQLPYTGVFGVDFSFGLAVISVLGGLAIRAILRRIFK